MNTSLPPIALSLLPGVPGLCLTEVHHDAASVLLTLASTYPSASCPLCQAPTTRLHSHYQRTVTDLPWGQHTVRLHVRVRRFRCTTAACPRRIFTERLPTLVASSARTTTRLQEVVRLVAVALGGEAGARLIARLSLPASPSTLLRAIRRAALPLPPDTRVVGVDDFALRRGQRYGTVLVDLTTHRPIDLLPDRTAGTLSRWLAEQKTVEVVCRDRSTEYARGIAGGAPTATQVLDRWHIHKNIHEVVERLLSRYQHTWGTIVLPARTSSGGARRTFAAPLRSQSEQVARRASRDRSRERYAAVRALHAQGLTLREIGHRLGLSRWLVRRYAAAASFPERGANRRAPGMLDPYLPYLDQRWAEGCHTGLQLWREVRERGYPGSRRRVAQWVQQQRRDPAPTTPLRYRRTQMPRDAAARGASPRQLTWLLLRAPEDLLAAETVALAQMTQAAPEVARAYPLVQELLRIMRQRLPDALPAWFAAVSASGLPDLCTFATGLEREAAPLRAALTLPWSNGPTEGTVNKIKVLKRQMYGRASLDLLRRRLLLAS